MALARPFFRKSRPPARGHRRAAAVLSVIGLLAVAGCGSDSGDDTPSAYGVPRHGGALTVLAPSEATSLAPFRTVYAAQADGNRMSALYDALVWTNPATGSVQPQIAESLTPVEGTNAKVWLLKIRPNVTFTDGTPFDAAAVKVNWDTHADEKSKSRQRDAAMGITTQVGASPLELRITLDKPNGSFDRLVARSLSYIASPKAIAAGLDKLAEHPVGAGPFMLAEGDWVKNDHMTLVKNPNYWQAGKPFLEKVTFRMDNSGESVIDKLKSGKADISNTSDAKTLDLAGKAKLGMEELRLSGGQLFNFDTSEGATANPDVRRAIVLSLSSEEIVKRVYGGMGTPARGIFNSASNLANVQLSAPENRPEEAAELFRKVTADGTKPIRIKFFAPRNPEIEILAAYVKEQIEKNPGVTVDVDLPELSEFVPRSNRPDQFDIKVSQLLADDPEPVVYQYLYGKSPSNCCFYKNQTVDKALDEARNSSDPVKRREAYTRLQLELNKDMPLWVYLEAGSAVVFNADVTGVQASNDGVFLFDRVGKR